MLNLKISKYYEDGVMKNETSRKRGDHRAKSEMKEVADRCMKNSEKRIFKKEMKNSKEIMAENADWLRKMTE